ENGGPPAGQVQVEAPLRELGPVALVAKRRIQEIGQPPRRAVETGELQAHVAPTAVRSPVDGDEQAALLPLPRVGDELPPRGRAVRVGLALQQAPLALAHFLASHDREEPGVEGLELAIDRL